MIYYMKFTLMTLSIFRWKIIDYYKRNFCEWLAV